MMGGRVNRRVSKTAFEVVWACIEKWWGYRSGWSINNGSGRDTRGEDQQGDGRMWLSMI